MTYLAGVTLVVAGLLTFSPLALAQQSPGYFIPPSAGGGAVPSTPRPAAPRPAAPRPANPTAMSPMQMAPQPQSQPDSEQTAQLPPLPPVPELPALPRGAAPPAAVIGVLGVPDVMRASTAAQAIERVIGERREKLNEDAQKEQAAWRDLQQALTNQRGGLTPEQVRAKERELQERITGAQRSFRDRNRIIQEAGQFSLGQIERTLIAVIRQVAESRGMNLVLHRPQVALNINEFDITEAVATQLNKLLPSVNIPPDGVSPVTTPIAPAGPVMAAVPPPPPQAVPAAAPAAGAPAPQAPPTTPPRR